MSKTQVSEQTVKKTTCGGLKTQEDCHSSDSHHNLKSKIINYIGSFAQAPSFLQDNRFILHGYRINYDSPRKIFKRFFFNK